MAAATQLLEWLLPRDGAVRRFVLVVAVMTAVLAWLALRDWRSSGAERRLTTARAEGVAGRTLDYALVAVPRAAMAGSIAGLGLLATSRWLGRSLPRIPVDQEPQGTGGARRGLLVATVLAAAYSAIMNAQRLDFSLWGDEDATLRKSVVGQFDRGDDGRMRFREVTWLETFYRYRDPNNHPLHSVMARLSHSLLARERTAADGFYFDERALRWPVFAAGLLAFPALAWLAWGLRQPLVGMVAVGWLALHPWHVRYAVEARGYGLLLPIVPLTLGCLVRAARTGAWRWWLGFGIGEFLALWAYPGALLLVVSINVSAVLMAWLAGPGPMRTVQLGRWVSVSVLGATLTALALAPCVEPLLVYLKTPRMRGPMPPEWYADAVSWLTAGMPWHPWDAASPLCFSWSQRFAEQPVATAGLLLFLILTLTGGAWWWWHQGGIGRALLPALGLFPLLLLLQARASGGFFCTWYTLPGLVGWVLLSAGGVVQWARGRLWPAMAMPGLFAIVTAAPCSALRRAPIEAMREGTLLTREIRQPTHPDIDRSVTVAVLMQTRAYDPAAIELDGDDDAALLALMADAAATGRPLHVHLGSPSMAREAKPRLMSVVEDPARFELVKVFPGHDAPYERRVYRAISHPAGP